MVTRMTKSIKRRYKEEKKQRKAKTSAFQNISKDEQKLYRVLSANNYNVKGVPKLNAGIEQMASNNSPGKMTVLLRE